jgi:heme-degrading monooxygenase HmoA
VEQVFFIAQLNVARARAPLEDPSMAGFASRLEEVYAEAERAEGFVWRLRAEDVPVSVRGVGDPRLFVTLSVWESIEALHRYVYRSAHRAPLRARAEWFEESRGPNLVLWWVERDNRPRVEQGLARLKYLSLNGPTARAFTFKTWFPPPTADDATPRTFEEET